MEYFRQKLDDGKTCQILDNRRAVLIASSMYHKYVHV